MSLAAGLQLTSQDINTVSTTSGGEKFGELASTADGRIYAFTKAGAVALVAGKITQSPASVANHINRTGVTAIIGTQTFTYTLGATAATADQYAGGYFVINAGTGAGQTLRVKGNTVATSGGSITVATSDPLAVATLASDSKFTLVPSIYSAAVISANGSAPGIPISGVPVVAVPIANYYWSQVGGYASVLSDGVIAKNVEGIVSNAVDGAVETRVDATVTKAVGYAPEATVTTEYSPFVLTLVS